MKKRLVTLLIAGAVVLIPLFASIALFVWVYGLVSAFFELPLEYLFALLGYPFGTIEKHAGNVLALLLCLLVTLTTGAIVSTRFGRWFHSWFDVIYEKLNPIYKIIRTSVKLFFDTLTSGDGFFSRVLLAEPYAPGYKTPVLLLGESERDYLEGDDETLLTIFAPHGPVGSSGQPFLVPKKLVSEPSEEVSPVEYLTGINLRFGMGLRGIVETAVLINKQHTT